jgi:hypothetical protein
MGSVALSREALARQVAIVGQASATDKSRGLLAVFASGATDEVPSLSGRTSSITAPRWDLRLPTRRTAQRPEIPIITVQQFLKHTNRESGVTTASLTRQDDPPAHLCGRHEPHHRALSSGGASPVSAIPAGLAVELDEEGAPRRRSGRGRPGRDPEDELAVAAQQRLGWRALSRPSHSPAGR